MVTQDVLPCTQIVQNASISVVHYCMHTCILHRLLVCTCIPATCIPRQMTCLEQGFFNALQRWLLQWAGMTPCLFYPNIFLGCTHRCMHWSCHADNHVVYETKIMMSNHRLHVKHPLHVSKQVKHVRETRFWIELLRGNVHMHNTDECHKRIGCRKSLGNIVPSLTLA